MTNSDTIKNINKLVNSDINIYQLFELKRSFTKKELDMHYKIKKAENEGNKNSMAMIEIAYHILKDEEMRGIYDHYRNKRTKAEVAEGTVGLLGSIFNLLIGIIGIILMPFIWVIKNVWWFIWLFIAWGITMVEPSGSEGYIAVMLILFLITIVCYNCARSKWWKAIRKKLGDKDPSAK